MLRGYPRRILFAYRGCRNETTDWGAVFSHALEDRNRGAIRQAWLSKARAYHARYEGQLDMDGGSVRTSHELPSAETQKPGLFDILGWNRFLPARIFMPVPGVSDSDFSVA